MVVLLNQGEIDLEHRWMIVVLKILLVIKNGALEILQKWMEQIKKQEVPIHFGEKMNQDIQQQDKTPQIVVI